MSVLGAMILDREAIGDVVQIIPNRDAFYRADHQIIFDLLLKMYSRSESIDLVTLRERLKEAGLFDQVGGISYLVRLTESVGTTTNADHYAHIVRDHAMLRNLIRAADKILKNAYMGQGRAGEVLDEAEKQIFEVASQKVKGDASHIRSLLAETFKQLAEREGQYITGLPSGFIQLDELTSGFQAGEMIVIAGRPSMGKSAFALNLAEHIGVEEKKGVAFFSLEMSRQSLVQRVLCSRAGVDGQDVRRGILGPERLTKLQMASETLQEAPIFIDDSPGMTALDLRAKARRLKLRENIACVVVDYLQLMDAPGVNSRQQQISDISRGIKALARELDIPVFALSQLNRSPESREDHRPRMSDLRESGAIEQDADLVILLHREEYYNPKSEEAKGKAEIHIVKQRNGPVGKVDLAFFPNQTRFANLSTVHEPPEYDHAAPYEAEAVPFDTEDGTW